MKKFFYLLIIFFFTSIFTMQGDGSYSEIYKSEYAIKYAEAFHMKVPGSLGRIALGNLLAHEGRKGLGIDILQPRLDAIKDVLEGKPHKFAK